MGHSGYCEAHDREAVRRRPGLDKICLVWAAVINDFDTQSGTIFGQSNAVGAEAVRAAQYFNTPAFGVVPPILAPFSSTGATPVLFDSAGKRLATPDLRSHKPEIVAPDGIDTTFFGSDSDGNGFPNFFGTSAAAAACGRHSNLAFPGQAQAQPGQDLHETRK